MFELPTGQGVYQRHHGYAKTARGYHPLLAIAAGTGDVKCLGCARAGPTPFVATVPLPAGDRGPGAPVGATGQHHGSGPQRFYAHALVVVSAKRMSAFPSPSAKQAVSGVIDAISYEDWTVVIWTASADGSRPQLGFRLSRVDRSGSFGGVELPTPWWGSQLALQPADSYHFGLHHRPGRGSLGTEADHRRHAEIENAIRELGKHGVGLNHLPLGCFPANGAWLADQVMA